MQATMSEPKKKAATDDNAVTTVKARQRVARLIRKFAALLEVNQEEVLDRYAQRIEDDLYAEMARQQGQIQKSRPGAK
jgi:uncharacterized membrane protein YccC